MKLFQVPRNLTTDPYNKGGQFGILIEQKEDIIRLEFMDGSKGIYSEESLTEIDEDFTIDRIFNLSATMFLKLIAEGRIDAKEIAIQELKRRGYDPSGKFVGFK